MQEHHGRSNADLEGAVLEALRQLVEHHSSARAVAERMGQAHNYVARLLRGETKLRLDVLHRVLEALGIPETYLLELLLVDRARLGGEQVLAFYGGDGASPEGDFLERYGEVLALLSAGPPAADLGRPSRRPRLEELADRRFEDPVEACTRLEAAIGEILDELEEADRTAAADLAAGLAGLGRSYRATGRRTEACLAFRWAFRAAAMTGDPRATAEVYQKASYLLRDLGFAQAALLFLGRASDGFLRSGDFASCAQVFVDRAVMWVSLGEHDQAIGDYEAGLRLLPDGEVRYRIAALSGLAHCHEQRDELADAITRLAEAEKLYGDRRDHALAFLVWNRANLAAKVGQHERAEVAYREAMEMLDRWSDPQDVALCALDLAQLYVRRGERSKLRKLSEEILAWLPALRAHRLADGVMMEVIRCAKWGEVTSQMLRESKAKIEAKSGKTRSRR